LQVHYAAMLMTGSLKPRRFVALKWRAVRNEFQQNGTVLVHNKRKSKAIPVTGLGGQ
jgi:hypothetical protein